MFPGLAAIIMYLSVGFQLTAYKFFNTVVVMILLNFNGMSFGLILASFFSDIAVALLVAPLLIMPLMMFSGVSRQQICPDIQLFKKSQLKQIILTHSPFSNPLP